MQSVSIPPSAAPYVLWSTEFVYEMSQPLFAGSETIDPADVLLAGFAAGAIVIVTLVMAASRLLRRLRAAIASLPAARD